ncbi:MAG: DNA polymerase III subunit delta' [Nitrospiraceae bacterium]|nr:DNA polymerase III subunit delta' [Nitrospiraceae bacterium]
MALKDVIGQAGALDVLKSALESGNVASSWLFQGLSGTGKRFAAINFAKALNCNAAHEEAGFFSGAEKTSGTGKDACDNCASCKRIDSGIHPDVTLIGPEKGVIKIEEIRNLEEKLSLRAFEGRFKVAVIDDAHQMKAEAANAFLKCLEEPPEGSVIILVSSNPERLPDTIRSRCIKVNFRPLGERDMEFFLPGARCPDASVRKALARLAMGRPGLVMGKSGEALKERDAFLKSLSAMLSGPGTPTWADRQDIEEFLDRLGLFLRDMLVMKITGNGELLLNFDMPEKIEAFGKYADAEGIIDCYGKITALKGSLVYNPNKAILWNYMAGVLKKKLKMKVQSTGKNA